MRRHSEHNRLIYVETIGWINGQPVVRVLTSSELEALRGLLRHRKTRLRSAAANRLGKLADRGAVDPLVAALRDPHWLVRLHAVKALGRIGEPAAINPIAGMLSDECPYVRRRVATALARLAGQDPVIEEKLIACLSDPDRQMRARVAIGLQEHSSSAAVAALHRAVRDDNANVSWRAIEAMQRIGSAAVPQLIQLLQESAPEVRYRAIKALGRIGDVRAEGPVKSFLDDPDARIRLRAKLALSDIHLRRASTGSSSLARLIAAILGWRRQRS